MSNIKRILMVTLLLCLAIVATVGLSSCEPAEPHVHDFEETVELAATCTDEGVMRYVCKCGYSYTEEIDAKDHTEEIVPAIPATCTEAGMTEGRFCTECGVVFEYPCSVMPLGHKPGAPATCTENQVCENGCGQIYALATDHFTVAEANCTEAEVCTICKAEVTPALGHNVIVDEAIAPTCFDIGYTEGSHCDVCHSVLVAREEVPATGHIYESVVTPPNCKADGFTTHTCTGCGIEKVDTIVPGGEHYYAQDVLAPTCTEGGYTTFTCTGCQRSYIGDHTSALGHSWEGAAFEDETGFYKVCDRDCGHSESVKAPVADSYKASVSKGFTSERANQLIIRNGRYGAWGITTNGINWAAAPDVDATLFPEYATMYPDILRDYVEVGDYVEYEFVVGNDGYVDIIWHIASSAWDGSTNGGLTDMAASMTITIDGKPVDIKNLALPAGDNVNDPTWWNMHTFVIKDVALEEGVHTFKCVVNVKDRGLNVGYMEIKSNRDISVRNASVVNTDIVAEGDKVYYQLKAKLNGYTVDDVELFDGSTVYALASSEVVDGYTVLKYDATNLTQIYPHVKLAGKNYVNGANSNGDLRDGELTFENNKYISVGTKHYVISTEYSMPVLKVYNGNVMRNTEYDLVEEDGKPILLLTYVCLGFDAETAEFFNGSLVLPYTIERNGAQVIYHIDLTATANPVKNFNVHLRIEGKLWNGKANTTSSNGDALVPDWTGSHSSGWTTKKTITVDGQEYVLGVQWSMYVIGH